MTQVEAKVKELADKLTDAINEFQGRGTDDAIIVQSVKSYLAGLSDGIALIEEQTYEMKQISLPIIRRYPPKLCI